MSKGGTNACLNLSWKTPFANGRLMMLVIRVRNTSRLLDDESWTRAQDLVGDLDMSFQTSSSVGEFLNFTQNNDFLCEIMI